MKKGVGGVGGGGRGGARREPEHVDVSLLVPVGNGFRQLGQQERCCLRGKRRGDQGQEILGLGGGRRGGISREGRSVPRNGGLGGESGSGCWRWARQGPWIKGLVVMSSRRCDRPEIGWDPGRLG